MKAENWELTSVLTTALEQRSEQWCARLPCGGKELQLYSNQHSNVQHEEQMKWDANCWEYHGWYSSQCCSWNWSSKTLQNVKNILSDVCDLHSKTIRRESTVISLMKKLQELCACCSLLCLCVWIHVSIRIDPLYTDILKLISHSCWWNLFALMRLCLHYCGTDIVLCME